MYLSRLEIFGFKSFAQKINMAFDSGITGIVGPNGCGKTNVVDALRWVLGEQRPTTLRSDKMEDVIFNGTKSRKPLNVAEVSVTIENSKGILPSEYTEVTLTRRVYRSGESEYYINRALCRLKDIRDLFMDTGMGSDAYSVIELKMVESILSDNSEERRRLFEESAGVTKYKHRRKEAVRRLESVRMDLTRLNDSVSTVQKAVNSLERQAHKAEKHNELSQQLKQFEIDLLAREYQSVIEKITPLKDQLSKTVDEKNKIDLELVQEETLLEVLRQELRELEARLSVAQSDLTTQQEAIHQHEQKQAAAHERQKSLNANVRRFEQEQVDLQSQREELKHRQLELFGTLDTRKMEILEAEGIYRRKKADLDEFELQLNVKKTKLRTVQDRMIGLLQEVSELRNRDNQSKARIENIRGRIEHISEEHHNYTNDIERTSRQILALTTEDRELRKSFAQAEVRTQQMEEYVARLQSELEQLRDKDLSLRGEIERKQARVDFLKGLVETYDGYSEGARYLISSDEWNSRIQTTVGDAVTTEPKYRVAIETALGEAVGYVIVTNVEQAYSAMDFLKKNKKGKATFICLDRVPSVSIPTTGIDEQGLHGWAGVIIRCSEHHRSLFDFLFDGTLIVEDVATANRIVSKDASLRCITLEGEIITGKGVVRGGSLRQDEGGHIGKNSQLEELIEEIGKLHAQAATLTGEMDEKRAILEKTNIKELSEEARSIEQHMTTVEVRIAQLEFEKKSAEDAIERNRTESEKMTREIASLRSELDRLLRAIENKERDKVEAERSVGALTSELETMEALASEYARAANEANVAVLSLKSEERSVQQSIEHADSTLQSMTGSIDQRTTEIQLAKEEIEALVAEIKETDRQLLEAHKDLESLKQQKHGIDQEFAVKRNRIQDIESKLKQERAKHEGSLQATYDLEMKIQELTMKAENLTLRAREEFSLALGSYEIVPDEQFDFNSAMETVRTLKEKIKGLGSVNFAAYDEYKSEKERLDFVIAQRDDLVESEHTMLETIEEINTTAQRKFTDTFELIRDNFITTFKRLFDEGDECDLRLEEGVDPLEARIEIVAKPRGKRPTSIDLLSGGEKTLTAIALLFAIYLVKPSPFCILDEVDAPLDDTNIDRFTRILAAFSDNTQFIVVTHNKRTMESANALYGVTMEEEGVSKLVSVRFGEKVEKS
jgi:chromosome segregation protein